MDKSNSLQHYGVLGMKWGVRKDKADLYNREGRKFEKLYKQSVKADRQYNKSKRHSAYKYYKSKRAGRKLTEQYDRMHRMFSSTKFTDLEKTKLNQDYIKQGNQYIGLHSFFYSKEPYYVIPEYSNMDASYEDIKRWRAGS